MEEVPSVFQQKFIDEFENKCNDLHVKYGYGRLMAAKDAKEYNEREWEAYVNRGLANQYNTTKKEFLNNKEKRKKAGDFMFITRLELIPQTSKERYNLLKEYTAQWFCYHYEVQYLIKALADDDINSIKSQIQELEVITKHESITDPVKRNKLYSDAKDYIHKYANRSQPYNEYSLERITLFIYILHANNFFDRFLIKADALNYRNGVENIYADVYGKYFLFYDYLKTKLKELEQEQPPAVTDNPYKFIKDTLKPLSGNWTNHNKIMPETEYERLVEYVVYIAENAQIPDQIEKIKHTYADMCFIQQTIYLIYREYKRTHKINSSIWIDFLLKSFVQFEGKEYIRNRFKEYSGNYMQMVELLAKS